jgi:tetratricopeptide (TPR) repeat protein
MAISETDGAGPPKRRINPIVTWLAACIVLWGLVGFGLFSFAPMVQCFADPANSDHPYCATALTHPAARGELRMALLRKQVDGYIEKGDYAAALKASDDIVAAGHAGALDYITRGNAWKYDSKYPEAAAEYREALRLQPGNDDTFALLMSAWHDAYAYDEARKDASAYIRRHPNSDNGYTWLGWTDYIDGQYAAASPNLRIAADKTPDNAAAQNMVALSLEKEGKTDEALAFYGKAIALDASSYNYLDNRALLYRDLNREAEAQADFRKSLRLSRSMTAIIGLARSYINDGKYDTAEPLVREALALDPQDESAHLARIRLDFEREDYKKAR